MKLSRLIFGSVVAAGAAHMAASSFARKLDQLPDPYQREELLHATPGEVTFIERPDGTRLRTVAAGSGTPVVLAHGLALTSMTWNLVAERLLVRGHRVIAFDQRGHGESTLGVEGFTSSAMAADYRAVIEHYDVKDAVLVAHSMGSFVALQYLVDHVDHVAKHLSGVVLVSPIHGAIGDAPGDMVAAQVLKSPVTATVINHPLYGRIGVAASFGVPSPSLVEALQSEFSKANWSRLGEAVDMMVNENLIFRVAEIELPVAVLTGTKDRIASSSQARRIASNLLHGQLVELEGVGHMPNWEAVDEIVRRVEDRILSR